MKEKRIQVYDSCGNGGGEHLQYILQYLKDEHLARKRIPLPDSDEWQQVPSSATSQPLQQNSYDCGVFVLTFFKYWLFGWPLTFEGDNANMAIRREQIVSEILCKALIL